MWSCKNIRNLPDKHILWKWLFSYRIRYLQHVLLNHLLYSSFRFRINFVGIIIKNKFLFLIRTRSFWKKSFLFFVHSLKVLQNTSYGYIFYRNNSAYQKMSKIFMIHIFTKTKSLLGIKLLKTFFLSIKLLK